MTGISGKSVTRAPRINDRNGRDLRKAQITENSTRKNERSKKKEESAEGRSVQNH